MHRKVIQFFLALIAANVLLTLVFSGCAQVVPDQAEVQGCPEQQQCPPIPPADMPSDQAFVQGNRLLPVLLIASDGTKDRVPGLWRDTALNEDCTFVAVDDGSTKWCLPEAVIASPNWFADAACTMSVFVTSTCDVYPRWAKTMPQNQCFAEVSAYRRLGEPMKLDSTALYWLSGDGTCIEQPTAAANKVVLPMDPSTPWDTFVSATFAPE